MSTFYANYPSAAAGSNPSTGANGLPAPTSSTEIGGINPSGNLQPLQTDASGNLLVDIASPITLSENIAQFGGNNVVTGTGVSGLGIPRVTVSSDSTVGLNAGTNTIGSINNISGTISLPTGAATAANQATEISSLSTIATNTSGVATSANQTNGNQQTKIVQGGNTATVTAASALKVDGSAVTQPISAASLPTLSNQSASAVLSTSTAAAMIVAQGISTVRVLITGTFTGSILFQGSIDNVNYITLNYQVGSQSTAYTTAAVTAAGTYLVAVPAGFSYIRTYASSISFGSAFVSMEASAGVSNIEALQFNAANLNATVIGNTAAGSGASAGLVTVQGNASATPIPISGTVTVSSFPSEQNVNLNQVGGSAVSIGQQLSAASIPVVLPAAQITTLTPPTTVTVTQSTGTNLHAVIDSSALPTGAATAANQTNASQKTQIVDGSANVIASLADGNGGFAIEVAQAATSFQLSTGNSSVAQLAAGASFTGMIDAIINQQSYSILLTSDQPGTLTVKQYIDVAGAHLAQSIVYNISAGVGFSRSGVMNGNYAQLIFHNTGASTTTTFDLNTYYGTIPASTQLNNQPIALNEVNGTALSLGQTTAANSIPVVLASGTPVPSSVSGTLSANAPVYNVYNSTNITTAAYTQLIASTSNVINTLHIFDSSGQAMILATGASGSEVVQLYVPPGGDTFTLTIPAGTRVAYKALTANATAGYLLISALQ